MKPSHTPDSFGTYLDGLIAGRIYRRIQFFSHLHELVTVDALVREIIPGNDGEIVALSTGDQIPMNLIVSVGGRFAPAYAGYELYCETCDC